MKKYHEKNHEFLTLFRILFKTVLNGVPGLAREVVVDVLPVLLPDDDDVLADGVAGVGGVVDVGVAQEVVQRMQGVIPEKNTVTILEGGEFA